MIQDGCELIGLKRYWLYKFNSYKIYKSMSPVIGDDIQWRIAKISAIKVHSELNLHTLGFEHSNHSKTAVLNENTILHLDWIVNSARERLKKLFFYGKNNQIFVDRYADFYLPEVNFSTHNFTKKNIPYSLRKLINNLENKKQKSWWNK